MSILVAALISLSIGHTIAVTRCLRLFKSPLLAYIITLPVWFVGWPLLSLRALWMHGAGIR